MGTVGVLNNINVNHGRFLLNGRYVCGASLVTTIIGRMSALLFVEPVKRVIVSANDLLPTI